MRRIATDASDTPPTVAVIGGGPTGILLAIRMAQLSWAGGLRVVVVERQTQLGVGSAFATEEPFHLLNVRACDMSALSEQPAHFVEWAARRIPGLTCDGFVPRRWYCRYLRELLDDVSSAARDSLVVEHRHAEAVGIEVRAQPAPGPEHRSGVPFDRPVRVLLDDGSTVAADRVVVAMSNLPPLAPSAIGDDVLTSQRYTANPWEIASLAAIPCGAKVLLVGTGLTMVDVTLWLRERRATTSIVAVSRHGWLPQVHTRLPGPRYEPRSRTSCDALLTTRGLLSHMRSEARAAEQEGRDWREIVDHFRHRTQAIWQQLPSAERRRFLRHCRRLWDVHRHRVASDVGAAVARLRVEEHLTVIAGHLAATQLRDDGVDVTVRLARGGIQTVTVDHIVNATGPACDVQRTADPLLTQLLASGLAVPDPLGLGLSVSDAGALITRDGSVSPLLFAAGSLRRGQLWEITAVPELRDQARELADHLHRRLGAAPPRAFRQRSRVSPVGAGGSAPRREAVQVV